MAGGGDDSGDGEEEHVVVGLLSGKGAFLVTDFVIGCYLCKC